MSTGIYDLQQLSQAQNKHLIILITALKAPTVSNSINLAKAILTLRAVRKVENWSLRHKNIIIQTRLILLLQNKAIISQMKLVQTALKFQIRPCSTFD